jgi:sec-independent protein translocase protein TatB
VFANVGWGEMLVLLLVGLVVLGPERLPGAIRWTAEAVRQAKEYLTNMSSQLREDIGPEFDDLREPLSQLQKYRGMTPRAALTKHLLDGDDFLFTGQVDRPPSAPSVQPTEPSVLPTAGAPDILDQGARPPFDSDAT